ncbi:hypothetical protein ACE1YR_13110 [Pseudomonas sp. K1(2024)]|uniref:Uncharacterized protein n=1 Tax=Pseudomonas boreofloridensis TaxID=3064348 RepID=A0ABV4Z9Q0_9PSED|nr:hypothetical protein [Pseudomonas sp. K13]MDO7902972.1 hypothetical protein [Pseudomonas sp. K13]
MSLMNENMRNLVKSSDCSDTALERELLEIVDAGLMVSEGCVLLKYLQRLSAGAAVSDFQDCTGYECFVNSLHIDDYVSGNYVVQAFLFVFKVFALWRNFNAMSGDIAAIVLVDDFGVVVKFHFCRDSEFWLANDLQKYEEAVLYMLSSDAINDLNSKL